MNIATNPNLPEEDKDRFNSKVEEIVGFYRFEEQRKRWLHENCQRTDVIECIEYDSPLCLMTCNYARERR